MTEKEKARAGLTVERCVTTTRKFWRSAPPA